jgi:hypothetical protein
VVAAGLIDQLARRATREMVEAADAAAGGGARGGRGGVAYVASAAGLQHELLFVHPTSALAPAARDAAGAPEWLLFREVVRGKRAFMRGCTAVRADWIAPLAVGTPLLCFSPPISVPPPAFDAAADTVVCFRTPFFGPQKWQLPALRGPFPTEEAAGGGGGGGGGDGPGRVHWFLRLLLEGAVLPQLAALAPHLALNPALVTRARAHPTIAAALEPLLATRISSRAGLAARWARDPEFLRAALRAWVQAEHRAQLDALWPALLASVVPKPAAATGSRTSSGTGRGRGRSA